MIFLSMAVYGVVSFQWFFWGYNLSFTPKASRFIGTLSEVGFMNVNMQPSIGSPKVQIIQTPDQQILDSAIQRRKNNSQCTALICFRSLL
jgi:Amt family ammonium transporter